MLRSTFVSLAVAAGVAVLATSVLPEGTGGSSARAPAVRADPATVPGRAPETGDRARWRWPLQPRPPILRPFRAPESTYGAGHRGLDLGATAGTPVLAVDRGTVTHAGLVAGRGTVTVAHSGGLSSTYEPLDHMASVGAVVTTGATVGTLRVRGGPGHCGVRVCLHLGARRGSSYLDPITLLVRGRLALLPLG